MALCQMFKFIEDVLKVSSEAMSHARFPGFEFLKKYIF